MSKFHWQWLIILPIIMLPLCLQSQCVTGKVIYSGTGDPARSIRVLAEVDSVITDDFGFFRICPVKVTSTLSLSYFGHQEVVNVDRTTTIQVFIIPLPVIELGNARISAFAMEDSEHEQPGMNTVINARGFETKQSLGIAEAINGIAGVRMENRGYGGSRRISIRSNYLRSPFAVRNVQLIHDDIPLTSPDGQSALELVDPLWLGSLTVIKDAPSAQYGAGHSGALISKTTKPSEGIQIRADLTGSGAWLKGNVQASIKKNKWYAQAGHLNQDNEGYRDQEANTKQMTMLKLGYTPTDRVEINLSGTHYKGYWELPGSITKEQALENPQQANPISEELNASVNRERDILSLSVKSLIASQVSNITSLYLHNSSKFNPFGTSPFFQGVKDESAKEQGVRSNWKWQRAVKKNLDLSFNSGIQYQYQTQELNNSTVDGDALYHLDFGASQLLYYAGFAGELAFKAGRLRLSGQAGQSDTRYTIMQLNGQNEPNDNTRFRSGLTPRLTLSYFPSMAIQLYAMMSQSFSNPSLFEYLDVETGKINALQPEQAKNYSAGLKWKMKERGIVSLEFFQQDIQDAIVSTLQENDAISYSNAGVTLQKGAEIDMRYLIFGSTYGFVKSIVAKAGVAFRDAQLSSYVLEGDVLDGLQIAGVSKWSSTGQLHLKMKHNLEWNFTHQWYDAAPLNNTNIFYSNPYHLLSFQISKGFELGDSFYCSLFMGVNNILDTEYTSFFQLNAFGGKYYNPAPSINAYGGIRLRAYL